MSQQDVNREIKKMSDFLSDIAKSTDGPGASRRGTPNFERRASAHRHMKSEAQRIMAQYPRSLWEHDAKYLETWANDSGYNG